MLRAAAQVNPYKEGTPGVTGYRSEVLAEVMVQEDKFTRLAEAIPADKYTWRPAADVRSFAEVFLHVSAANYNLYKMVGTPPPSGLDLKDLEKSTTDKAKIIATLKDSFAHAKAGDQSHARRRSGKEHGLVRRQEHRTRRPAVHRSSRRRTSRPVHRLQHEWQASSHHGPKTRRKRRRRRKQQSKE